MRPEKLQDNVNDLIEFCTILAIWNMPGVINAVIFKMSGFIATASAHLTVNVIQNAINV